MTADAIGGVWTYAIDLARALHERGARVTLCTMGRALTPQQREQALAAHADLHESTYRLEWMDAPWDDVAAAGAWLQAIAERVRPDVVHLNNYAHASLPWEVPVVLVAHSCVGTWWRAVHDSAMPEPEWTRYRQEVGGALAAADILIAPTHAQLAALQGEYDVPARTRVIPNGRDGAGAVRPRKEPLVFAAGRFWDPAKNLPVLRSVAERSPWPICVAGAADAGHAHPQSAPLRLLGELAPDEVAAWAARAAIYAAPALYEPFGLAILEAAQAGCALLLADIPTLRELWHGAAVFAPPRDVARFGDALRALIAQPARREALGEIARGRALRFTTAAMGDAYLAVYRDLLERNRRSVVLCA